ncbi:DUF6882 domain-containing protein [Nocardia sp. XZ_19_385]|uniref:DUF6882 domain-containing protein n=1 Tax=Nocardia sp. XZ_19_385 TaxID=2769488 RepID=UPI001E4927B2|nr:DUF6882 domain-containing protein [Nocardia sp. XZ_19_385]
MGLFKRRRKSGEGFGEPDLAALLAQGEDMIGQLANAHMSWGLGSADRWDLDQRTGLISWTFPDQTATAPAQIIGSYNPSAGTWMWAWANKSILPEMSRDSEIVCDWANAHGYAGLAEAVVEADDEMAATLAALVLRVTEATGFYRGTGTASIPFITFGPVTLTSRDGQTSTFAIEVST